MPNSGLFILFIVVAIVSGYLWNYRQRLIYIKQNITDAWGRQKKQNYKAEEIDLISSYFKNTKDKKTSLIDDITWNDLNMNEVFSRINNTQSSVGEEFLYNILREPLYDEAKLKYRDNIIEFFGSNEKERVQLQYILARLGKDRRACISDFFESETASSRKLIYYRVLSIIPVVCITFFLLTKVIVLPMIAFVVIVFNSFLHFSHFKANQFEIRRFDYMSSMVVCAQRIVKLHIDHIKGCSLTVRSSINNLKKIKNKLSIIISQDNANDLSLLGDYFKMFFLLDVIKFERTNKIIAKKSEDIKNIYEFIGEVDSCIAIASYRKSLDYCSKPVFRNSAGSRPLNFKEIYHPLIEEPISNSCEIQKSILITGSNASGKSTFLKTIAINAIMAQTIYTCLASEYESSFFKIYTSMALRDDIIGNDSYYIVEIKSLKRIMESIDDRIACLCVIDEILRGTNTIERISASSEVLNYLAQRNCLCISATHDVELTTILNNVFENYHFQEKVTGDQITFDYRLYPGRAETRNAIKLLSIMGYSKDVVANAEKRAEDFLENGIWNAVKNGGVH